MLFRTRIARRHRALAMVADRGERAGAPQAVVDGANILRWFAAAPRHRPQARPVFRAGGQRPGMDGSSVGDPRVSDQWIAARRPLRRCSARHR
jgi:hypothetical protein